jgi:hypothetical protein
MDTCRSFYMKGCDQQRRRGVHVVFCIPGSSFSGLFLEGWTDLVGTCLRRGITVTLQRGEDAVVHFARVKCLRGSTLAGPHQVPLADLDDYDYVMWIDSDMVFTGADMVRLLESPHPVTSGLYRMRTGEYAAVQLMCDEDFLKHGHFRFLDDEAVSAFRKRAAQEEEGEGEGCASAAALPGRYMRVAYSGMGWMLVAREALRTLRYPWFAPDVKDFLGRDGDVVMRELVSEDVAFCMRLEEAGFPVHLDLDCTIGHEKRFVIM